MLVYNTKLPGTTLLSVQAGGPIGRIASPIIDPDELKIIAFVVEGPSISPRQNILATSSIREYSNYGMVIDSEEELVTPDDVIKIQQVLALNFNLINLRVITKKHSKLGKVSSYTFTAEDFVIQQLIVKRPALKGIIDPELTIPRQEIVEVTDHEIVVKDEEKVIKSRATKEDFIPNFVNPFRTQEPDFAPIKTKKQE